MDSTGTVQTLPTYLSLYFDCHKGSNLPMATSVSSDMVAAVSMAFDAFTSQDVSSSLIEEHNQNLIGNQDTVDFSRFKHNYALQAR